MHGPARRLLQSSRFRVDEGWPVLHSLLASQSIPRICYRVTDSATIELGPATDDCTIGPLDRLPSCFLLFFLAEIQATANQLKSPHVDQGGW